MQNMQPPRQAETLVSPGLQGSNRIMTHAQGGRVYAGLTLEVQGPESKKDFRSHMYLRQIGRPGLPETFNFIGRNKIKLHICIRITGLPTVYTCMYSRYPMVCKYIKCRYVRSIAASVGSTRWPRRDRSLPDCHAICLSLPYLRGLQPIRIEREVSESDYLDAVRIMPRASKTPLITHLASLVTASTRIV